MAASSPSSVVGWPVVGPMGRSICSVSWMPKKAYPDVSEADYAAFNAECGANARLIAAAPDLLEAAVLLEKAEEAHANCDECGGEEVPELCPKCFPLFDNARLKRRAAIAKAEGRAP